MITKLEDGKYIDDELWLRYLDFCNTFLIIGREPFDGQPFKPMEWQKKWFLDVFCTYDAGGNVVHKYSHTWICKKQGKTTFLATVILFISGVRKRDQIIVLAQSKDKAKKNIWGTIQEFIDESPELKAIFWDRDSEDQIINEDTKTKIILESGKSSDVSGYNSGLIVIDEVAELQQVFATKLYGRLKYAGAAKSKKRQVITISTANYDRNTLGYSLYCATKKKLEAVKAGKPDPDPTLHGLIYEVAEGDENDPEKWWPAMPSVPGIVPKEFYLDEYRKAKLSPLEMCDFRCFLLNQWISTPEQWHNASVWESNATDKRESEFHGCEAMIGCDFASHQDLMSWVVTVRDGDKFLCFPRFLMAKATAEERANKDGYRYIEYATKKENNLYFCDGEKTDGKELIRLILDDAKKFKVKNFLYDPYGMEIIRQELEPHFQQVTEVPQKGKIAAGMWSNIDELIVNRKLLHPNNDVLNFCYFNCKPIREDDKLEIVKASKNARIDGIDATAISLLGWINKPVASGPPKGQPMIFSVDIGDW